MSNMIGLPEPLEGLGKHEVGDSARDNTQNEQATLIALVADVIEASSPESALDALAGAVQQHLGCQRVTIASAVQGELTLRATTQHAFVVTSSSESTLVVDAMQEACDREAVVRWPTDTAGELGVLIAHRALAGRRRSMSYCSVPIYQDHHFIGAMLLERRDGMVFSNKEGSFREKIAIVVAPLLALHLKADRGILEVCRERVNTKLAAHMGNDRPGRRVILGINSFILLAAIVVPVDSHISAAAELVPLERRLITAPRSGFIESVNVVAGEQVEPGQLLATLDARDLELEVSRSGSDIATAEVEFRAAMANFDRQASAVARARLAQTRAQQMLVARQLEQSSLRAPIAGLILNTDPGDTLGAPVSRGDTLFEIAPVEGYEVHLLVNETDIRDIYIGQIGELSLRARPEEALPLTVLSVHPIAETGSGTSRFRVRAGLIDSIDGQVSPLHPGESGQARLDAGHKSLIRILFSPLWRRLTELKWRLIG